MSSNTVRAIVCVSVCVSLLSLLREGSVKYIPLFIATQLLDKHDSAATNTRNRRIVGRVIFCAVRALSKEDLCVRLCTTLSLLGKNSVKTFPRQRRIVGGVVFYAVCVISKELTDWSSVVTWLWLWRCIEQPLHRRLLCEVWVFHLEDYGNY
jgi:hypothetical protein